MLFKNDIEIEDTPENRLKQIDAFYGDIKMIEQELSYEKENITRSLKNGLGEDILNTLNNKTKPNYWKGLKLKIKRWYLQKKYNKLLKQINDIF